MTSPLGTITQRTKYTTRPSARGAEHSYIYLVGVPPGEEVTVERYIEKEPRPLRKGDWYVLHHLFADGPVQYAAVQVHGHSPGACFAGKPVLFFLVGENEFVESAGWRTEESMQKWLADRGYTYDETYKEEE